jgi:hypothetical protein
MATPARVCNLTNPTRPISGTSFKVVEPILEMLSEGLLCPCGRIVMKILSCAKHLNICMWRSMRHSPETCGCNKLWTSGGSFKRSSVLLAGALQIPKRNNGDNPRDFGLFWTMLILLFSVGVQRIHHGLGWTGGFPRWLPFVNYLLVHAGLLV